MQTYEAVFNEEQRLMFLKALQAYKGTGLDGAELEEVDLMIGMLENMPKVEAEHPDILHGLCY